MNPSLIKGLYGIADAAASGNDPERMARHMLEGGCRIIQLRCKEWKKDEIERVAKKLVKHTRQFNGLLIINDHPDIALSSNADGVHLGQMDADYDPSSAKGKKELIVGRSTQNLIQAAHACPVADYVAVGPIYNTKNRHETQAGIGTGIIELIRATLPANIPIVAIGGIEAHHIPHICHAGADAFAIIGAIAGATDPVQITRNFIRQYTDYMHTAGSHSEDVAG